MVLVRVNYERLLRHTPWTLDLGVEAARRLNRETQTCDTGDASELTQFCAFPRHYLTDYGNLRQTSPLGHVFGLANHLHHKIDAVLIIGPEVLTRGIRAMFATCCHPYHNELTRAARGSKPRMYFLHDRMDHDAIAALLDRVASGGYGEMNPERRHQIVMVDDGQSGSRIAQYLARAIDFRCFASHSSRPEEQVIAVLQRSSPLWDLVPPGQWLNRFEIPDISSPELNMMTPVVLLPAAFLGLDCIQWLVGAMEMTQHFLEEPVESNQVLRFAVACDYLAGRSPGVNSPAAAHVFEASQQSLSELAVWCNHVVGPWNSAGPPTVPDDPDAHRRPAFDRKIRLNCTTHRHDRFPTLSIETKQGLGALLLESIGGWLAEPKQAMPQNPSSPEKVGIDIIFPRIDTRVLGQFFQMMGITSQITRMFVVAANTSNPST